MLKLFRFGSWWLYQFLSIGVPLILINSRYEFFSEAVSVGGQYTKLNTLTMILIIIVLWVFKSNFKGFYATLPNGALKDGFKALLLPAILFIFWSMLRVSNNHIENLTFITFWTMISNSIGAFVHLWHLELKAKDIASYRLAGKIE
jgi:hypothetical protein